MDCSRAITYAISETFDLAKSQPKRQFLRRCQSFADSHFGKDQKF